MIIRLKNNYLFITTLIFCFLGYFAFQAGSLVIPYYFIFVALFLLVNLIFAHKKVFKNLIPFFKTNSAKYLGLLILWIILGIIISTFRGTFNSSGFITTFMGNFLISQFLIFFSMVIALPHIISFKQLSKILLIVFFVIFFLGILEFIGDLFNIEFMQNIFSFLVNKKDALTLERHVILAFGFPRISSVFQEASYLAGFIVISSPLVYHLCFSKIKILKKRIFDILLKRSTFVFMIVCLFLTQSPIFVCLQLTIVFIALLQSTSVLMKKKTVSFGIWIMSLLSFVILIHFAGFDIVEKINMTESSIGRIIKTISNFSSMGALVFVEPSLATRIGNFAAQFHVFLDNPITGVGYGNINSVWAQQVLSLPFPITSELCGVAMLLGTQKCGASMFFKFLSETGLVGTFLLFLFFGNLLYGINKNLSLYKGIEKDLIIGLKYTFIVIICTSFYDTFAYMGIQWLYIGIIQAMLLSKQNPKENK